MLRAVQTVTIAGERRTVSFRTLTVEQIGYVYEGLLSFEGFRAAEVVVGLIGKEGREEEVPLADLEALGARAISPRKLAERYKDSGIGSVRALAAKLAPLAGDEQAQAESRLYAVAKDHALVQRLLPYYGIIRRDLRGDPVVILPGAAVRHRVRAAGQHRHPLHAEVPRRAGRRRRPGTAGLLPGAAADGRPLRSGSSGQPEEILGLTVADIAMGSGAFLVAACRYLAGKLLEAWSAGRRRRRRAGAVRRRRSSPAWTWTSPRTRWSIKARRAIIEHCLYGVDINPMAVEMAKLSLWLVSMDPGRPFTFLDDKLAVGDSLLGITSIEQLEWMHLNPAEGRKLHEDAVLLDFMAGVRRVLADVSEQRSAPGRHP